jgi:hypothetical protein
MEHIFDSLLWYSKSDTMLNRSNKTAAFSPYWIILLLVFVSCDDDFEPLHHTDVTFSVYGYLDSDATNQVLRVVPLRNRLRRNYTEADLSFSTTSVGLEGIVSWENRLFLTLDGENALGSVADFRPVGGATYSLQVSDPVTGRSAKAETRLPVPIQPEQLLFDTIYQLDLLWVQNLFLDQVTEPHFMEAIYTVRNRSTSEVDSVAIAYQGSRAGRLLENRGTAYVLFLQQDADSVYKALGMRVGNRQLELLSIQMRMSSLSDEWNTPGGTRDPEVLAAPGVWSNVSYGLGFFGSITRSRRTVPTLPAEVVFGIGF